MQGQEGSYCFISSQPQRRGHGVGFSLRLLKWVGFSLFGPPVEESFLRRFPDILLCDPFLSWTTHPMDGALLGASGPISLLSPPPLGHHHRTPTWSTSLPFEPGVSGWVLEPVRPDQRNDPFPRLVPNAGRFGPRRLKDPCVSHTRRDLN